jgi:hypothetical protein
VAWKILRGALVASTEMVTLGVEADQPQTVMSVTQIIPKTLESFMFPWALMANGWIKKINAAKLETISARERKGTARHGRWVEVGKFSSRRRLI